MARILVTGSADGLGLFTAGMLAEQGHEVTVHARSRQRAEQVRARWPEKAAVVLGDLAGMDEVRAVAERVNALGRHDAVIHNAGVGNQPRRVETVDGFPLVFAVNVLAPYLLTALLEPPDRLVYLSSGMHRGGDPDVSDALWVRRRWNGSQAYSDSKLYDTMLAFAVARRWPRVRSNSVNPGWVATRMGGRGGSDDLEAGVATQVWLAVGAGADATGEQWYHRRPEPVHPGARDLARQDALVRYCAELTGTALPQLEF
jgi:NAD(P)-dependent dehydrogenase (short-subunit alcohol dehydrogenase family)